MKDKRISIWIIIAIILLTGAGLIWLENPLISLEDQEKKWIASLTVTIVCLVILLFDGLFICLWQWLIASRFIQTYIAKTGKAPEKADGDQIRTHYDENVKQSRRYLRDLYGRRWGKKVRILLVVGCCRDVEQLTPGLTTQFWQEARGTLLLWGGDPAQPVDQTWLTALRRLRRRPADGLVWVTTVPGRQPEASLTEEVADTLFRTLQGCYRCIGWRLPLYAWFLQMAEGGHAGGMTPAAGCLLPEQCRPEGLTRQLQALIPGLVTQGIQQICNAPQHHFLLSLADRLTRELAIVTGPLSALLEPYRPLPLAGVVFSPEMADVRRAIKPHRSADNQWHILPDSVQALPAGLRPYRQGAVSSKRLALIAAALMLLWGAGMTVSFLANRNLIAGVQMQVQQAQDSQLSPSRRLLALADLQKTLTRLQYREAQGTPWYLRAGMDQNTALLTAVQRHYGENALPLLRDVAALHLQQQLNRFAQLPPDSPQRAGLARTAYDQLRLYLMLAQPQRMDPAWFSRILMQNWPQRDGVTDGIWQANGMALLAFYGAQSVVHPAWQLAADEALISQIRTRLIRQMGLQNSDATLYQKIVTQVASQFADLRLTDMIGDTDAARLFATDKVVPGMFTRQAWEEAVRPAIEKQANRQQEDIDWVLSDGLLSPQAPVSPAETAQRLTARYFADFSGAWLDFLNSLRLQKIATLSDAIDQLTLMADVRQSPLVALMQTLNIQGRTGEVTEGVSDSLVKSAKNLFSRDKAPVADRYGIASGPLDTTFGPLLALMDNQAGGNTALNLQTFLTRLTQVRLRLQQVISAQDPQAMTRTLAQTVFQGKAVDLNAIRDYGSLIAAGLGQAWHGFGQTVFVRPMEQAWQQVLDPAAESLNARWRAAVVDDWNRAFASRYPFKHSSSDASLPLLANYLNTDAGRITRFLQTSLNGVLHREGSRWVPDSVNAQGLTFDPAFLKAINTLSRIADVVFTNGAANLHFELRPGTAAGVMQTDLIIDSQTLTYVNQLPGWKRFSWPADTEAPGASLSWISTDTGTRQYADLPGSWGFIRLLDRAQRKPYPGTGSSWQLSWKAQDGRMLNYILRTEAGEGPLALLALRNFTLPDRIFSVSADWQQATDNTNNTNNNNNNNTNTNTDVTDIMTDTTDITDTTEGTD